MESQIENIKQLETRIDKLKNNQFKRNIFFTLIPVLVGVAWMVYSVSEVNKLKAQKDKLIEETLYLQKRLDSTINISTHLVNFSFGDLKLFYARGHGLGKLVSDIYDAKAKNIKFSIEGSGNSEFNSPAFMSSILKANSLIDTIYTNASRFSARFPNSPSLQSGNLIIYKGGFVMLYVETYDESIHEQIKFSIGMTLSGILAVEPTFAEIESIKEIPGLILN